MTSFLEMFRKREPKLSNDSRAFVENLGKGEIWILAVGLRDVPVVPNIRDPKAWGTLQSRSYFTPCGAVTAPRASSSEGM